MNLRRLAGIALWHAGFRPTPARQEAEARIRLYSTESRRVRATPKKHPTTAKGTR